MGRQLDASRFPLPPLTAEAAVTALLASLTAVFWSALDPAGSGVLCSDDEVLEMKKKTTATKQKSFYVLNGAIPISLRQCLINLSAET